MVGTPLNQTVPGVGGVWCVFVMYHSLKMPSPLHMFREDWKYHTLTSVKIIAYFSTNI